MDAIVAALLRPGKSGSREVRADLLWLGGLLLILVATGIGLRDPWPADEPRFALIARDMVANHQWLIPSVGGDVYADKPPLFFWMIASLLTLTGSMRISFLLPSLLATAGCVVLIYDLARRLWNRETGLAAALALLFTAQYVWQARQAQIDATLCFFTTLGLYGLLRHCLLGPDWKWYAIGWAAAGLGIITKGVGFLPLLVLIPYAFSSRGGWMPRPAINGGWRWLIGPLALLLAVSVWLVPMLMAAQHDPALQRYRDEILFGQTVHRYAGAWHHREPFWYFVVNVIPGLWLPFTALLPWLIPQWREALRARDQRIFLPLAWIVLVVLFFSLSSGKRGVYVLPALPALAIAVAPFMASIAQRRKAQMVVFVIVACLAVFMLAGSAYMFFSPLQRHTLIDEYGVDVLMPLLAMGGAAALVCLITRTARGFAAWGGFLAVEMLIVSFMINPVIDASRSSAAFIRKVEQQTRNVSELGVVAYKEQFLLHIQRPIVNFGHARWREAEQETADAAAWQAQKEGRVLLMDEPTRTLCFKSATARLVGIASGDRWYLVEGNGDPQCIERGHSDTAIKYRPPALRMQ
ncbi:MAG: ArnT family glycosyltransferase [Povalibacter sp.]